MNARTKNLAVAGGAAALLGIIGVNVLASPGTGAPPVPAAASPGSGVDDEAVTVGAAPATPVAPVGGAASPGLSPVTSSVPAKPAPAARRSYAIGLQELRGLPPDAAPGTAFELWVTWEPPVTDDARLHRLIADVVLERIVPGSVPEAPVSVLLSVPAERTGDLIYADTFGSLSAVLPGDASAF